MGQTASNAPYLQTCSHLGALDLFGSVRLSGSNAGFALQSCHLNMKNDDAIMHGLPGVCYFKDRCIWILLWISPLQRTELLELPLLINRHAQDSSSRTLIAAVAVQSKVSVLYCQPWIRKQIIDLLWVPPNQSTTI